VHKWFFRIAWLQAVILPFGWRATTKARKAALCDFPANGKVGTLATYRFGGLVMLFVSFPKAALATLLVKDLVCGIYHQANVPVACNCRYNPVQLVRPLSEPFSQSLLKYLEVPRMPVKPGPANLLAVDLEPH